MNFISDDAGNNSTGAIKVIGIGQSLRGDDGAGLAAVRLWQERFPEHAAQPDLQVELAELPGIGLLNLIEGARLAILVDAVRSGASAGTIHQLSGEELEAFGVGSASAHGWGVAETLSLGAQLIQARMPHKIILVGIEAGDISVGASLSPPVEHALGEVAHLIEKLITN